MLYGITTYMDITYLGHSSFRIKSKQTVIITDPYAFDALGKPYPGKIASDIVTISCDLKEFNNSSAIDGSPYVISGPGEYEIKGIGIIGYGFYQKAEQNEKQVKNTVYRMDIEGMNVVHLGNLDHVLTDEKIDHLGSVDILCIPVGGHTSIGPKDAAAMIKEISPSIIIPMQYKCAGFDTGVFEHLHPVTDFLSNIALQIPQPIEKLSVQKESISEEPQVVLFR